MALLQENDPDRPLGATRLGRLQLRGGRALISAVNLLRPRITLGVRLLALNAEGEVFLVRHSYLPGFHLPGGGVGPGETVREAALREASEEGALVCVEPPELFGIYLNLALARRDHVVLFVARDAEEGEAHGGGLEVVQKDFFPLNALPEDATPATRTRIEEVLFGRPPSEIW